MAALDESTFKKLKEEIIPFLTPSARPDIKYTALGFFLGLTGQPEGIKLIRENLDFLEAIVSLTTDEIQDIAKDAFRSLLNLAADDDIAWQLLNSKRYPTLCLDFMKYLLNKDSEYADLVVNMFCNMTRSQRCAVKVANTVLENPAEIGIERLVTVLCNIEYNKFATLDSLCLLLSNLTQIAAIRHALMDKKTCLIQKLLPFTEYQVSHFRRGGIVGTLKNCCFETEYHDWLMGDQVDMLPRLLLPLAGPDEFDEDDMDRLPDELQYLPPEKEREPDPAIRTMLIEAITQLCSTKKWRLYIKEKNTYVIMRELHKWEKNPANNVAIMSLIDILIGDEPGADMEDLNQVEVPQDLQEKFHQNKQEMLQDAIEEVEKQ